mgnify:CR=1 FL=1
MKKTLDKIKDLLYNNRYMRTTEDIKVHIPIEVRRLDALASACKKAQSDDFKALWYHKMMEIKKKYKLVKYVTDKLIH